MPVRVWFHLGIVVHLNSRQPKYKLSRKDLEEAKMDSAKLSFIAKALKEPSPFEENRDVDPALVDVIDWLAERDPETINQYRRDMVSRIEAVRPHFMQCHTGLTCVAFVHVSILCQADRKLRESGKVRAWYKGCDSDIYEVG